MMYWNLEESMAAMAASVRQSFVSEYRQSHKNLKAVLQLSIERTKSLLAANLQMLSRRNSGTSGKKSCQWTYEWLLWQTGTVVGRVVRRELSSHRWKIKLSRYGIKYLSAACLRDKLMERLSSSKKKVQ